jgi:hypothetical protein
MAHALCGPGASAGTVRYTTVCQEALGSSTEGFSSLLGLQVDNAAAQLKMLITEITA